MGFNETSLCHQYFEYGMVKGNILGSRFETKGSCMLFHKNLHTLKQQVKGDWSFITVTDF